MKFWKYITAAFSARPFGIFVPPNWIFVGATLLAGWGLDPGFLLIGGGLELAYLFYLASNPRFRNFVDGVDLSARKAESQAKVADMISLLPTEYADRYNSLVSRCRDLLSHSDGGGREIALGLDRLLWIYLKLLRTSHQLEVVMENPASNLSRLQEQARQLEAQLETSPAEDLQNSLSGTLATLQSRIALRREAESKRAFCISELSRIEQEVERVRDESLVSPEPVAMTYQVNAITSGLGSTSQWMQLQQEDIFGSRSDESDTPGPILAVE